jgi:putative DNA primase/helicase
MPAPRLSKDDEDVSSLPLLDAEKSILGGILLDNRHLQEVGSLLVPGDFSLAAHQTIFSRMRDLHDSGQPVDMITLAAELNKRQELEAIGEVAYLSSLLDGVPDRPSLSHYAGQVKEAASRRRFGERARHALLLSSDLTVSTTGLSQMALQMSDVAAGADLLPPASSEEALAQRFSRRYADELRYVAAKCRWMCWDGARWREDRTLVVFDRVRGICRAASSEWGEKNPRDGVRLASKSTVAAVERLAQADRRHAATADQWDANRWLLNTPTGTVDLRTGDSRLHNREHYITKITAASAGGICPIWRRFVDRVTDGDLELQSFLQRMIGYSLTGSIQEHAVFFLYGTGANGKSVFLSTIREALGEYAKTASPSSFTASRTEQHPTDLAGLQGARLVIASETENGTRWAESKIKSLTGGDKISARFMRGDFFEYSPEFKLIFAGNHKPGLSSVDEAMRRRLHLVPFTVTIPENERDPELAAKLREEFPGILAWAIQGCLDWQRLGLNPPARVREATADYMYAEDAIGRWLEECCIQEPGVWTGATMLFTSWQCWASDQGEYVGSMKRFTQELEARGYRRNRTRQGRGFTGLVLQTDP